MQGKTKTGEQTRSERKGKDETGRERGGSHMAEEAIQPRAAVIANALHGRALSHSGGALDGPVIVSSHQFP